MPWFPGKKAKRVGQCGIERGVRGVICAKAGLPVVGDIGNEDIGRQDRQELFRVGIRHQFVDHLMPVKMPAYLPQGVNELVIQNFMREGGSFSVWNSRSPELRG